MHGRSSGRQIESDRFATLEVFEEFLLLCYAAGPACAISAPGVSAARWAALAAQIKREPLVLYPTFTYTYDLLIADAAGAMYAPEIWSAYAAFVDLVADLALEGQATLDQAAQREQLLQRLEQPRREADYPNFNDAFYGNHCADGEYPKRFRTYRTIGAYATRGSQFGPRW